MDQPLRLHPSVRLATALTFIVATAVAHAQSRDCSIAARGIGVSIGRVSPYLDLSQGAVDNVPRGSILVRNGVQLAVRGDLPIAGPWREPSRHEIRPPMAAPSVTAGLKWPPEKRPSA